MGKEYLWKVGFGISGAQAAWTDDFESYTDGVSTIPSPWETCAQGSGKSLSVKEISAPNQVVKNWASGYTAALQYRAVDAADIGNVTEIYGKVHFGSDYTSGGSYDYGTLEYDDGTKSRTNTIEFGFMANDQNSVNPRIRTLGTAQGAGDTDVSLAPIASADLFGNWYDLRMVLTSTTVTGEYKAATDSTWITVGTLNLGASFAPSHVGIMALNAPEFDDVGYSAIPEPATMILLGIGVLGFTRRR